MYPYQLSYGYNTIIIPYVGVCINYFSQRGKHCKQPKNQKRTKHFSLFCYTKNRLEKATITNMNTIKKALTYFDHLWDLSDVEEFLKSEYDSLGLSF